MEPSLLRHPHRHRRRAWLLVLVVSSLSTVASASPPSLDADAKDESKRRQTREPSDHSVSLAWYGHYFTNPGFSLGYSYRALTTRDDLHSLVVGAELGTYWWARHDTGLFVTPRVGWRGRGAFGLQGEVDFHLGYLHGFLPGTVYEVVGDEVRETTAGFPYLWFGITTGIGWYFEDVGGVVDIAPFARIGAFWQYPVFDQILIRMVGTIGVEVRL